MSASRASDEDFARCNAYVAVLEQRIKALEEAIKKALEDLPHQPYDAEYRLEAALSVSIGHGGGGQSMKVYLAARFERRDELRGYRDALQKEGIEVTSRWLDCSPRPDTASSEFELFLKEWGIKDEEDVRRSDALVLFTHGEGGRGGMNVEYGLAVGLGKRVLLVGPWVNAFHLLPTTTRCASFEEAKRRLTSFPANPASPEKIGRASCRERV